MNTPKFISLETSPSSRKGIELRIGTYAPGIDRVAWAYHEMAPEDFVAPSTPIVPPSREVQEYAAKLAAANPELAKPDVLAAQQAVQAAHTGSN